MDVPTADKKSRKYLYIVWTIRILLLISIVLNVVLVFAQINRIGATTKREFLDISSKPIELVAWAILTFVLSFLPEYFAKMNGVHLPTVLAVAIVVFIYAAIFLSAQFDLYYRFFWWDDLLHTLSGMIIGFLGVIVMYILNEKYSMDINPLLVAVFSFSFAVSLGVFWEIFEFATDALLGTANQKWDLPNSAMLLGQPYQGSGLRDTMSDLIVDCFGALLTSVISYFLYKNEKSKTLELMKKIYPDRGEEDQSHSVPGEGSSDRP
jgi:hypothetical protein